MAYGPKSKSGQLFANAIDMGKNVLGNVTNGGGSMNVHPEMASILCDLKLPAAGGGAYLGTMDQHRGTLGAIKDAHKKGVFGGVQVGASAAFDYFSGMNMSSVQERAQIGAGMMGDVSKGQIEAGTASREAIAKKNPWNRGRIARAGVRTGILGAGIAAADFLNPFSWGD